MTNFFTIGAFSGLLIGLTILINNPKKYHNRPLGVLMVLLAFFLIYSTAVRNVSSTYVIIASTLLVPFYSGIYIKSLLNIESKFSKLNWILFSVFLVATALLLNSSFIRLEAGILLLSLLLAVGVLFIQFKSISDKVRNAPHPGISKWITIYHLILFCYYLAISYAVLINDSPFCVMIAQVAISSLLLAWTIALVLMPNYLFGGDRNILVTGVSNSNVQDLDTGEDRKTGYTLKEDVKKEYIDKILDYMESEKPYLSNNFTLNKLSQELDLSPTYTSRVINKVIGKNFKDFVNRYRIDQACEYLSDEKMKNFTIEAVAQESGFHSRTAFYNAFKKIKHMSPGEFMFKNSVLSKDPQ